MMKKREGGGRGGREPREDGTSIPKNLAGSRPAGEIRDGKMLIKGEEA